MLFVIFGLLIVLCVVGGFWVLRFSSRRGDPPGLLWLGRGLLITSGILPYVLIVSVIMMSAQSAPTP